MVENTNFPAKPQQGSHKSIIGHIIAPRFTIGIRFVVFIVLMVLFAGAAIGWVLINTTHHALRQEVLDDNLVRADLTAQFTSTYITGLEKNIGEFTTNPVLRQAVLNDTPEQAQSLLSQFIQIQAGLSGAAIYDEKGIQRVFSNPSATTIGQSFMDRDYVSQAITTGKPYLGLPTLSRATGTATAGYAVPILDDQGKVVGAVSGGISLSSLSAAFVKIGNDKDTNASIIDTRNGGIIVANLNPQLLLTQVPPGNQAAKSLVSGGRGTLETTGNNGTLDLVGFAPVSGLPWGVMVTMPTKEAMAIVDALPRQGTLFTGLIILFAAVIGTVLMLGVTRPLRRLVQETKQIGHGNLNYEVTNAGEDEIGDLARAFGQMVQNLSISRNELLRDIAERKLAEEKLKRSETFSKSVLDSTDDAISVINVNDFTVAGANRAFLKQLGLSEQEIIGKTCYHLTHHRSDPCTPPDDVCPLIDTAATGKSSTVEHIHYTKSGEKIYVEVTTSPIEDEDGKIIQVVHSSRDISERRKAEETLRLQASLLDVELDSVYLLDLEGHILYANKATCVTHGYTREELLNMNLSQLDDPDSANLIATRIKEILEKGYGTFNINHRRKDGSIMPMEIHTTVVEADHKQLLLSVARDLTERKKLEEQLMAQDRLVSIGQLVSGVAHEINNPLTGIIGFSELLLQRDLPADVEADVKIINDEAQRTAKIVQNLLTFSRQRNEGKALFNIHDSIERVLALRAHEETVNNIKVSTHFAQDLPRVEGSSSQLQQVFFNLIVNAEQAMLEANHKGTLTIITERSGDNIRVSIADDGPGISPENMNKLFTPFFTTKGVGKGTGLGLSISNGIITAHGGRIYAESGSGKGAAFIVELPVTEEQANG